MNVPVLKNGNGEPVGLSGWAIIGMIAGPITVLLGVVISAVTITRHQDEIVLTLRIEIADLRTEVRENKARLIIVEREMDRLRDKEK